MRNGSLRFYLARRTVASSDGGEPSRRDLLTGGDTLRKLALLCLLLVALVGATAASAHNAAHFYLPDGSCHQVGSDKEAPYVGAGNPHQTTAGQLDLLSDPRNGVDLSDQYGARWAAEHSDRLLPGDCPA